MLLLTVDFEMKQPDQQKIIVHAQILLPKMISDFILIIHSFSLINAVQEFTFFTTNHEWFKFLITFVHHKLEFLKSVPSDFGQERLGRKEL